MCGRPLYNGGSLVLKSKSCPKEVINDSSKSSSPGRCGAMRLIAPRNRQHRLFYSSRLVSPTAGYSSNLDCHSHRLRRRAPDFPIQRFVRQRSIFDPTRFCFGHPDVRHLDRTRFRLARDLWRGHLSRQGDRQGFPVRRNGNRLRGYASGPLTSGTWTGPAFVWQEIFGEGIYHVRVIAKDFQSGETATAYAVFALSPLSTGGSFVVSHTANPLVALGSAPARPAGSSIRLTIQRVGRSSVGETSLKACTPQLTSNIFAAGMLPSTAYSINYEVITGSKITKGPSPVMFPTGPPPSSITFPTFTVVTPPGSQDDAVNSTVLHAFLGGVIDATDRLGNILWYYAPTDPTHSTLLTRPLPGGH